MTQSYTFNMETCQIDIKDSDIIIHNIIYIIHKINLICQYHFKAILFTTNGNNI